MEIRIAFYLNLQNMVYVVITKQHSVVMKSDDLTPKKPYKVKSFLVYVAIHLELAFAVNYD